MEEEKVLCPLCGVLCSASKRVAHLKHCSQRLQLNPQQLIAAAQLQVKHESERKALGLPALKTTKPIPKERKNGAVPQARKLKEPKSKGEADLQMAMALSASLQLPKVPELVQTTLVDSKKRVNKKSVANKATPALILVSEEQRRLKWAEKVEFLLAVSKSQVSQPISNPEEESTRNLSCRLWLLSSQSDDEISGDCFYVKRLVDPEERIQAGSKLWHLSQVAGRRSAGGDCSDLCYSLEGRMGIRTDIRMDVQESPVVKVPAEEVVEEDMDLDFDTGAGFCSLRVTDQSSQANSQSKFSQLSLPDEETSQPMQTASLEKPTNTHVTDFLHLVGRPIFSDSSILTSLREIPIHKAIIFARCPALLLENMSAAQIDLSEYSHKSVLGFLQYLYAGSIQDNDDRVDLLRLAERFKMPHLLELMKSRIQKFESEFETRIAKNGNNISNDFSTNASDYNNETLKPQNELSEVFTEENSLKIKLNNEVWNYKKTCASNNTELVSDNSMKIDQNSTSVSDDNPEMTMTEVISNNFLKGDLEPSSTFSKTSSPVPLKYPSRVNNTNEILSNSNISPVKNSSIRKNPVSPRSPIVLKGRSICAELICNPVRIQTDNRNTHNVSDPFNDSFSAWDCLSLNNSIESSKRPEPPRCKELDNMKLELNVSKPSENMDCLSRENAKLERVFEAIPNEVIVLDSDSGDANLRNKAFTINTCPSSPELFGNSSSNDSFELPKLCQKKDKKNAKEILPLDMYSAQSTSERTEDKKSFEKLILPHKNNSSSNKSDGLFKDSMCKSDLILEASFVTCQGGNVTSPDLSKFTVTKPPDSSSGVINNKIMNLNNIEPGCLDNSVEIRTSPVDILISDEEDPLPEVINKFPLNSVFNEQNYSDHCLIEAKLNEEGCQSIKEMNISVIDSTDVSSSPKPLPFNEPALLSPCSSPIIPSLAERLGRHQSQDMSPDSSPKKMNRLTRIKSKMMSPPCSNFVNVHKSPVRSPFTLLRTSEDPGEYLETVLSQNIERTKSKDTYAPCEDLSSPILKSAGRLAMKHSLTSPYRSVGRKRSKLDFESLDKSLEVERAELNASTNSWDVFPDDINYLPDDETELVSAAPASSVSKPELLTAPSSSSSNAQTSTKLWLASMIPSIKVNSRKESTESQSSQLKQKEPIQLPERRGPSSQVLSPPRKMPQGVTRGKKADPKGKKKIPADSPVTPLPDYKAMVTPELKVVLKKFGIKGMPRKKAVPLLTHIYHQTHPGAEEALSQVPSVSARKELSSSDRTSCFSSESSPSKSSMETDSEEDVPSQPIPNSLKEALRNFILADEKLHEKILFYEPLSVPEFMLKLQEVGLKPTLPVLYNFFDEQGITFTNPRDPRPKKRARKTKASSKKKSPKKKASPKKKRTPKKKPS